MTSILGDIYSGIGNLVNTASSNARGSLGLGPRQSGFEQLDNIERARKAAAKYGVSESVLVHLLMAEGGLKTDPGGNGGGIGQFLDTTAKDYGTSQEELRSNPDLAIDLAARHLKKQVDYFKGDVNKGVAAYFVGAGTIDLATKGPNGQKNWLQNAEAIAQAKGWGSVQKYVGDITAGSQGDNSERGRNMSADELAKSLGITVPGSGTESNTRPGWTDPSKFPQPQDFRTTLSDGTVITDWDAYSAAVKAHESYIKTTQAEKEAGRQDQSQFMDDIIDQIGKEIAVGGLKLSQANSLIKTRSENYKTALDAFSSDAFKYGAPAGAQYVPGTEPGSYMSSIGFKPITAQQGNFIDPVAEAMKQTGMAQSDLGGVDIPTVPNIANMRRNLSVTGNPNTSGVGAVGQALGNLNIPSPVTSNMAPNVGGPQSNPYAQAGDIPAPAPSTDPVALFQAALKRVGR